MAENELLKLYREELEYVQMYKQRIVLCHKDALQELLRVIGKKKDQVEVLYMADDIIQVTYWID